MWKPTEDELRRAFKRLVFNPTEWRRKACQLRRSAEKLEHPVLVFWERFKFFGRWHSDQFPPGDYLDAYYLLWGYSIENLLKSCVVNSIGKRLEQEFDAKQAGTPKKRSKLPRELASHKQLDLASHADLQLNDTETILLYKLTLTVEYGGKYPTPLRYFDGQDFPDLPGATWDDWHGRKPEDPNLFRAVFERLWEESAQTGP